MICIIDDDEAMRCSLTDLMRSAGYEAKPFGTAQAFLNSTARSICRCIITDIQMPGLSGIDLMFRLNALGSEIPVIMITARPEANWNERAMESGAICFLRKPFEASALFTCVEKAFDA